MNCDFAVKRIKFDIAIKKEMTQILLWEIRAKLGVMHWTTLPCTWKETYLNFWHQGDLVHLMNFEASLEEAYFLTSASLSCAPNPNGFRNREILLWLCEPENAASQFWIGPPAISHRTLWVSPASNLSRAVYVSCEYEFHSFTFLQHFKSEV